MPMDTGITLIEEIHLYKVKNCRVTLVGKGTRNLTNFLNGRDVLTAHIINFSCNFSWSRVRMTLINEKRRLLTGIEILHDVLSNSKRRKGICSYFILSNLSV